MRQNLAQLQVDWPLVIEMELINRDQALNCNSPDKKNAQQVQVAIELWIFLSHV